MKRIGSAIFAGFIAGYFSGWSLFASSGNADDPWLEITNVNSTGVAGLIHNSFAQVPYAFVSKQSLLWPAWSPEATFYGTDSTNLTSFSVPLLHRRSLFLQTRSPLALRVIASEYENTVVLKRDGTVWAWGINDEGQLGGGQWSGSPVPVQVAGVSNIIAIATPEDGSHTLALDSHGIVWSWGRGWDGQLGRNDGLYEDESVAAPVPDLNNIVAVACGCAHSIALRSDGTVWAWGDNWAGQLGDGTRIERDTPEPVFGLTNAIAIASGSDHNFALCADGTVWAWGFNAYGGLGIGNTENQLLPVRVDGLENVAALSGGDAHSLALLHDGTVMAWGDASYGQSGNGTYDDSWIPVTVPGLSNIVAVASGGYHNVAVDAKGTLFEWGDGEWDQLGNGIEDIFNTPFALDNISNVVGVAAGEYNTVVMTADGRIFQWGVYGYLDSFDWRQQPLPFMYNLYDTTDSDGDLLPDWFERQFGTLENCADSLDSGVNDYELVFLGFDPVHPPQLQLGLWKFDNAALQGEAGQLPLTSTNLARVPDWSGNALHVGSAIPAWLTYREAETNISKVIRAGYGTAVTQANYSANITLRQGTIQFWFRPDWSSRGIGGPGPGTNAALIAIGHRSGDFMSDYWGLEFDAAGDSLRFSSQGGGERHIYCEAPGAFSSNQWYQIALTYNTNTCAIYTNGQVAAFGGGVDACPDAAARQRLGFNVGSEADGENQAFGLFDNLETFNYSMPSADVAGSYFQGLANATCQMPPLVVNTNNFTVVFQGVPLVTVAVLVNDTNNFNGAVAQTYSADGTSGLIYVPLNLGTTDGINRVAIGVWNGTDYDWMTKRIVVDTTPPVIYPATSSVTTDSSLLQLTGYAIEPLSWVAFDLVNSQVTNRDQPGFIVQSDGNTFAGAISTNGFQCFDVSLAPGLNTITVRCADLAGNVSTNIYSYTLDTEAMPAPTLSLEWPADGMIVGGNKITVKGRVSDPGATVWATVIQDGSTNNRSGLVERDGTFWVDDVSLGEGTNSISVFASNGAGYSPTNTVMVQTSPINLTVDPMNDPALSGDRAAVSGSIDSSGYTVTVNGVAAVTWTNSNGKILWQATNVPVNAGGVAVFRVQAVSTGDPELLAAFNKPARVRVSHYRENLKYHWRGVRSLPPRDYLYDEILLNRSRTWDNERGGSGTSDFYIYAETYAHAGYGILGPCQTQWQWPAESWPPDPPDSTLSQSCSSDQPPDGNPLSVYSYWWGNGNGLGQEYAPAIPCEHKDYALAVPSSLKTTYVTYYTASCDYDVNSQTRLELVVGDRADPGKTSAVMLKVSARTYSNPSGWGGPDAASCQPGSDDAAVAPSKIRIAGMPCVDSGDGVNGFVTVIVPRGATNLDITPFVDTDSDCYSFDIQPVDFQLAADNNRDGIIAFDDSDATAPGSPCRFWINDSVEAGDIVFDADDQIPGMPLTSAPEVPQPNFYYDWIRGHSDAVNFFPVLLKLGNTLRLLPPSEGYEYRLVQNDAAVKFVYTTLAQTNAFDYLTNPDSSGYGAGFNEWFTNADTVPVTSPPGAVLDATWLDRVQSNDGTGVILLEGSAATTNPLWLEVWRNGRMLAGTPLYLNISPVEQMFRHKNLMAAAGGAGGQPDRLSHSDAPNEPPTVDRNLVFLHGYNVNADQARGVLSEMFKRFYWSGSKARFYGVTWNGADSQVSGYVTPDYHTNVIHAVSTAEALATFLGGLSGTTAVAAHSLGNMVVLCALNDYNARLDKYFMIDAAVAIEALDDSADANPDMAHPDWVGYDQRLWASEWHNLFPTNDARSTLTWRGRFSNLHNADVYNFYSSGEEVLRAESGAPPAQLISALYDQALAFLEGEGGAYVWVWQEKAKGVMEGNTLIGSAYGGWGFNIFDGYLPAYPVWYVGLPGGRRTKTPAEIDSLTADILNGCQFNPLFKSGWGGYLANNPGQVYVTTDTQYFTGPNWILGLYQAESGSTVAANPTKNIQLLADAVPALTLPVGANHIDRLVSQGRPDRNFDMQMEFENGWPSSRPQISITPPIGEWRHSDFDYAAYPFDCGLFNRIVNIGNLK